MPKLIAFDLMGVLFPENILERKIGSIVDKKNPPSLEHATDYFINTQIRNNFLWKLIVKPLLKIEKFFLKRTTIDPVSDDILEYLKNNYKLAIISDLPKKWGTYLINKYKLDETFNPILISSIEKTSKKEKKIFELLINKTNISSEEIVLVDDKKLNLKNASELGIKTIWFKIKKDKINFTPDYVISSLEELKKIL